MRHKSVTEQSDVEWSAWLRAMLETEGEDASTSFGHGYQRIADRVVQHASVHEGDLVVDVGTGTGLLAFAAGQAAGSAGRVIGVDSDADCIRRCRGRAEQLGLGHLEFRHGNVLSLPVDTGCADAVLCRSVLCHIRDKRTPVAQWHRVLKEGGRFSLYEPVDRHDTRFADLVDFSVLGQTGDRM